MQRPTNLPERKVEPITSRTAVENDGPVRPPEFVERWSFVHNLWAGRQARIFIEGECRACRERAQRGEEVRGRCPQCPPEPKVVTVVRRTGDMLLVMDDGSRFGQDGYRYGETDRYGWRTALAPLVNESAPALPAGDATAIEWEPLRQWVNIPGTKLNVIIELRDEAGMSFHYEVHDIYHYKRAAQGDASTPAKARSAGLRAALRYLEALRTNPRLPEDLPELE
jgi:hypothetical protein